MNPTSTQITRLNEVLQKTIKFFKDKGLPSARLDAELVLAHALGWERIQLYTQFEYPLTEPELERCRELVRRRASGEPVAYILGYRDFYKSRFFVEPGVLIPRPETEGILELVPNDPDLRTIVDLGCGSGCIGLSLLLERPHAKLLGVDVSPIAISVSKRNAERLGLTERSQFLECRAQDLDHQKIFSSFSSSTVDVVVANPPYIDRDDPQVDLHVRQFEPSLALFSENSGLEQIESWSQIAAQILRPGGVVVFEIGADQGQAALDIFSRIKNFERMNLSQDLSGRDRFVRAQVKAASAAE